jgi:proton-translocating NADH-quinone oxidoreductase chain L
MLLKILILPLLSSVTLGLFGRLIGRFGAMVLSTLNMWLAALLSFVLLLQVASSHNFVYYNFGKWLSFMTTYSPNMKVIRWEIWSWMFVDWELTADSLTVIMLVVVTTIAALVHTFSIFYMGQDPYVVRFFTYLSRFAFFMLVLVTANNFLILFVGWEGVGIMSFVLINFWFTRALANKAAIKAVVVNRIGDVFLLAGLALIFSVSRAFDFGVVFPVIDFALAEEELTVFNFEWIGLCLLLAAVGKSAQLGRHTWLPDAMEGPTPVSALIHAATMVTAGIVLIIRSSNLFVNLPSVTALTALLGISTAFFAATAALVQYDIKKIIAYSTCSQLGYMLFASGLQQYQASLFHLFNHAFFKALLFLAAGSVIHAMINEQDSRRTGGVGDILIFIFMLASIGTMALAGSTFLAGFYSKDIILESSVFTVTIGGLFLYWIGTLTAVFTGIYSSDILDDVFAEESTANISASENVHSSSVIEFIVLTLLGLFSVISGYVCRDLFIGLGSDFFGNSLAINNLNAFTSAEFLPLTIKLLPTLMSRAVSFEIGRDNSQIFSSRQTLHLMSHKWYFDSLQNLLVVFPKFKLSYTTFWVWDKYFSEMFRVKSLKIILRDRFKSEKFLTFCSIALTTLVFCTMTYLKRHAECCEISLFIIDHMKFAFDNPMLVSPNGGVLLNALNDFQHIPIWDEEAYVNYKLDQRFSCSPLGNYKIRWRKAFWLYERDHPSVMSRQWHNLERRHVTHHWNGGLKWFYIISRKG